ncbi:DUF2721 domain-containing protein [Microvirga sp. Mcv34]|uniref:DUF2721 domain-containing protein n=1 Tax=Microvirga sp. Mcv34 TaxID=2926016 RepID=UPI0021CA670D|nr:DUF2721 domain-containing protein [Microvirga sp. Mcv34]
MLGSDIGHPSSLDSITHIIQVALTPIFLLSGIASLLNVFSNRLARVADKVNHLAQALESAAPEEAARLAALLSYQRRRSLVLDAAVVLGALGGGATSSATLVLFLGALRNSTVASLLFILFGFAIVCTIAALAAFVTEMLMASRSLRAEVSIGRELAAGCRAHRSNEVR